MLTMVKLVKKQDEEHKQDTLKQQANSYKNQKMNLNPVKDQEK